MIPLFHVTGLHSVSLSCFRLQRRLVSMYKWEVEKGADIIERYVRKGDRLYVEGSIEYRQWTDKEGQTRYTTEIRVRDMVMLSGRSGGEGGGDFNSGGGGGRSRSAAPERPRASQSMSAPSGGGDDFEDFPNALETDEDDLPF